jgi:type II restriction/modification system DNA methylase subunit YeeA
LRAALAGLTRFIATPTTSKYRVFSWLPAVVLPSVALIAVARDDDFTFGVLQSRAHDMWSLAVGTQLETRPRYTPNRAFETFPFPRPTEPQREAIAEAARDFDRLRTGWLNPAGLSDAALAKRTLTNLYNARPTWLAQAHERLDAAVLAAYGWPADINDEELLTRLLALNLTRAEGEASAGRRGPIGPVPASAR